MKLRELFDKAIQVGIDNDPRGREDVAFLLEQNRKNYEKLDEEKKKYADKDLLENPFSDSRILHGAPDTVLKRVMVGVDMEGQELLLADRLNEKGRTVDLVISHHPEGRGLATLSKVMPVQADIWHSMGVPITVAESLIGKRAKEIDRRVSPSNTTRSVDMARILDIPFICLHTPADNCVTNYLQNKFDSEKPRQVSDIMSMLFEIPEYQEAANNGQGPTVILGSESRRTGKILVDMTGGTGGPKEVLEKIAQTDVGTIVGMHMSEDNYKEAEKNHLNVVIAGHISSDVLGLNLLFDQVLAGQEIEFIGCSGFKRVERKG